MTVDLSTSAKNADQTKLGRNTQSGVHCNSDSSVKYFSEYLFFLTVIKWEI